MTNIKRHFSFALLLAMCSCAHLDVAGQAAQAAYDQCGGSDLSDKERKECVAEFFARAAKCAAETSPEDADTDGDTDGQADPGE